MTRRSQEWLDEHLRKQERRAMGLGNVEPVQLCRDGGKPTVSVQGHARSEAPVAAPVYPIVELCRGAGLPIPVPEFRFHASRKWRLDWAWPHEKVALEIEGGLWVNGRHSRGSGAVADLEKYSEAAIAGWRVLYATPEEVKNGVAMHRVMRALRPLEFAA